jgi:hypothetical protein
MRRRMSGRILLSDRIERLSQNLLEPRDVRRFLEAPGGACLTSLLTSRRFQYLLAILS